MARNKNQQQHQQQPLPEIPSESADVLATPEDVTMEVNSEQPAPEQPVQEQPIQEVQEQLTPEQQVEAEVVNDAQPLSLPEVEAEPEVEDGPAYIAPFQLGESEEADPMCHAMLAGLHEYTGNFEVNSHGSTDRISALSRIFAIALNDPINAVTRLSLILSYMEFVNSNESTHGPRGHAFSASNILIGLYTAGSLAMTIEAFTRIADTFAELVESEFKEDVVRLALSDNAMSVYTHEQATCLRDWLSGLAD